MSPLHLRNQLHHHDPSFVDRMMPLIALFEKYFRYEAIGVENIPDKKGCLVVMNHGIITYHGFLLAKAIIEKRGIYPRSLGAGFLFDIPYVREAFLKGGTVNANPRNAKALLRQNHCVFLAPGGIYEGLVCHPGMKRIPWERRYGFIRMAVEAKVPIVPTYCDGINDIYFNSKLFLKARIKILEATRFSIPLFYGLGLLPLPRKLIHFVDKPIYPRRKRGESQKDQIHRIHHEVLATMKRMAD